MQRFPTMAPPAPTAPRAAVSSPLRDHLRDLGEALAEREAEHAQALEQAWSEARRLRVLVADAVEALHSALADRGLPHLRVTVGEPRLDDKHIRAVQFELIRGRTVALVSVKSRGEVTLVGPFRAGKTEGPCETVPWEHASTLEIAMADFLERFLEQAMTP